MTILRMRIACWIPKATNTHSYHSYCFPLQQWLRERAPMIRYAYIACLVRICIGPNARVWIFAAVASVFMKCLMFRQNLCKKIPYKFRTSQCTVSRVTCWYSVTGAPGLYISETVLEWVRRTVVSSPWCVSSVRSTLRSNQHLAIYEGWDS